MNRNVTLSSESTRSKRMMLRLCRLILALCVATGMAHAQVPAAAAPQYVRASIEAETRSPAPGDVVTVAIVMDPKPGWHDYWVNPGDAGTPLELAWQLPAGIQPGPLRAPVPETLIVSGFMNHIYKSKHAFLVDLKIPNDAIVGQNLDIKVDARWSACSDLVCVPESATLSVPLTVGAGSIGKPDRTRFDAWRSALPVPLDRKARYALQGNRIDIAIPYPRSADASRVWFFAQSENLFRYAAPQSARRTGDWLIVSSEVKEPFAGEIEGLLRFNDAQGLDVRATPGDIPTGGAAISVLGKGAAIEGQETPFSFGWILAFSVLGGLLLNLMPCVFPILGLKALSLAKMGGDEGEARRDAVAYTVGIVLSCLVLGGIMLALRTAGEEVGWAFQLQDPAIVLLLLLLMIAVTANLAGLFEIGGIGAGEKLTRKGGMSGSFWTGVLAAVVATPCTGPFMAAAMGAALLLPATLALLIFAGLGFGLALPFLAIAFIPLLRKRLPRPGPWMIRFRQWMAVPMALTSLALLWLLYQLAGFSGVLIGGTAALILLSRLFELGRKQKSDAPRKIVVAAILGITIAAMLIIDNVPILAPAPQPVKNGSLAFDEEQLAALRAEGKPVFLYFTADWCVTCKVNEKAAIDRKETNAAFAKAGIQTMVGDYTRRDPDITRFLAKYGRSGVPLYVYYPPNADARLLPQILTVDDLTALSQ
ncbi:protein-disulfide reductase DsbD family protein [Sphingorhabdus sp.]|jgi:DsbC/DsbD-like thiol-disulfide interchange protein/cytochrome c biogenesis protein CcdA|uniref:protein-disulfide reductase DsbD family protein n=1 Tax=Sphingorhabdus sp. TaxID=1902408 RepID=UPI0037C6794D